MKKSFVLDGSSVKSVDDFYDEVQRVLCPGFKSFGRNWNAFRDVLRGGFTAFEEDEEIDVIISSSKKMRKNLPESQYRHIIRYFEEAENITLFLK